MQLSLHTGNGCDEKNKEFKVTLYDWTKKYLSCWVKNVYFEVT